MHKNHSTFSKIMTNYTLPILQRVGWFVAVLLVLSLFLPSDIVSAQTVSGESNSFKVQGVIAVPIQVIETVTTPVKASAPTVQKNTAPVKQTSSKVVKRYVPVRKAPVIAMPVEKVVPVVAPEPQKPEHLISVCVGSAQAPIASNPYASSLIQKSSIPVLSQQNNSTWSLPTDDTGALSAYMFLGFGSVLILLVLYFYSLERKVSHIEDLLVHDAPSPRRKKTFFS